MKWRVACLATIALADYVLLRRNPRWFVSGLLDVPAHLATAVVLRDLASGPGVPLLWPLRKDHLRVPYAAYAAALTVLAVLPPPRG